MAVTTLLGTDTTVLTGSSSLELRNKVSDVEGNTTGGTFGFGVNLGSAYETELTSTSATSVMNYVPTTNGIFIVMIYFRVITASTIITVEISYDDATGAQTIYPVNGISEAVGSYNVVPIAIAATTATNINIIFTAGTANQVFASVAIVGL